jgi:hypothetical protein
MSNVPEYPDYGRLREEMFPGKQEWQLNWDERAALRDAMTEPEAVFRAAKEIWERYYTMVGNTNATLKIARSPDATPTATHEATRVLTKREFEKANRYRDYREITVHQSRKTRGKLWCRKATQLPRCLQQVT